jgi:hypothetical protein
MAQYPTYEETVKALGPEGVERIIGELASWERAPITIAELTTDQMTPDLMHAWAYLAEALFERHPDAHLDGFKVVRDLTHDELTEKAITHERNRVYQERIKAEEATK